jgi:hypothetical protein
MNSLKDPTKNTLEEDLKKLTSEMKTFETLTTSAGLIGAVVGSILAIPLGPIAFVSGAALGAAAVGGLNVYAHSRKKELEKHVRILREQNAITENTANEFISKLGLIHTDNPGRAQTISLTSASAQKFTEK